MLSISDIAEDGERNSSVPVEFILPMDWTRTTPRPNFFLFAADVRFSEEGISAGLRIDVRRIAGEQQHSELKLEHTPLEIGVDISDDGTVCKILCRTELIYGNYIISSVDRAGKPERQIGVIVSRTGFSCSASANEVSAFLQAARGLTICANGQGKSGTTWLFRLLSALPGFRPFPQDSVSVSGSHPDELLRMGDSNVFHGHFRHSIELMNIASRRGIRFIQIVRDPRDVIVSEYFHQFHMLKGVNFPTIATASKDELLSIDSIRIWSSSYYGMYDNLSWKYCSDFPVLRYEDLISNTPLELSRCLGAIGVEIPGALAEYAANVNSFEYVTGGRRRGQMDPTSPVRNAIVGNWREHITRDTEIALSRKFEVYLRDFSYSTATLSSPYVARGVRPEKEIVLHVGAGKTGSTAIQRHIHSNVGRLAERGIVVPLSDIYQPTGDDDDFSGNGEFLFPVLAADLVLASEIEIYYRFLDIVERLQCGKILISCEMLEFSTEDKLRVFKDKMASIGASVSAIYFVRDFVPHAASFWLHTVRKHGETRDWPEFAASYEAQFESTIRTFWSALGRDRLVVRKYVNSNRNSVISDFYRCIGEDASMYGNVDREHNTSLGQISADLALEVNRKANLSDDQKKQIVDNIVSSFRVSGEDRRFEYTLDEGAKRAFRNKNQGALDFLRGIDGLDVDWGWAP